MNKSINKYAIKEFDIVKKKNQRYFEEVMFLDIFENIYVLF
jgi:hypothetical protein